MDFTSSEIKAMVAGYFRYKKQCPVIAFEASDRCKWASGEPADILIISESRMLYEIEVKISLSDMKGDKEKRKHYYFVNRPNDLPVYKFYFAVPNELANAALEVCKELYPYAGLLVVTKFPFNSAAIDFGVKQQKAPKCLNNKPLAMRDIVHMVKEQSGTVCRLARDKAVADRSNIKTRNENVELEKYLALAGVAK